MNIRAVGVGELAGPRFTGCVQLQPRSVARWLESSRATERNGSVPRKLISTARASTASSEDKTMSSAETHVITILAADHREMMQLIDAIRQSSDPSSARDLADTLIAEIMRHAVAEEMYVYPAIEDHVPEGEEEVAHEEEEHGEIVRVMKEIERADVASTQFMQLIARLEEHLRHHARDAEDEQFPKLRAHVPGERLPRGSPRARRAVRRCPGVSRAWRHGAREPPRRTPACRPGSGRPALAIMNFLAKQFDRYCKRNDAPQCCSAAGQEYFRAEVKQSARI